ncbi:MAG: hypothetical protein J0H59_06715 [Comamonadaceae bacterium]|nr:hypothetical protein [Comamonadaceae bacterium]
MTTLSAAGLGTASAASLAVARAAAQTGALPLPMPASVPQPSTQFTASAATLDVVYARPATTPWTPPAAAWAGPAGDALSAMMERNSRSSGGGLAAQWRGVGGALLAHLAATGTDYQQTRLDRPDPAQPLDAQFRCVADGAATVSLQVQTRAGQTVDLRIALNPGTAQGAVAGMQVEISSSGALDDAGRAALAALSGGLEQVLQGLGAARGPALDMANLLAFDRSVLASVELRVVNPEARAALSSFSLRLGDGGSALALQGAEGRMEMRLDAATPLTGNAQQRQAAIAEHLRRIDAAAARGRAGENLVALFKSAFAQMHGAPAVAPAAAVALPDPVLARAQALVSGLVDFEAHFDGDAERTNQWGFVNERSHAAYSVEQKTEAGRADAEGRRSIVQTQSERLQARYLRGRNGSALDTEGGNYDLYQVDDRHSATTTIQAVKNELRSARRHTDTRQHLTFQKLVNHRVEERRETPEGQRSVVDLLSEI